MPRNLLISLNRLFVCTLIAAALAGCASVEKQEEPAPLAPVASKFKEIPVPSTFKQIPESSYSFESSIIGIQVGIIKYEGKAPFDGVVAFYKEQMPKYKWTLENSLEYGNTMLNFGKINETCLINISSQGDLVTIDITLGPRLKKIEQILPK